MNIKKIKNQKLIYMIFKHFSIAACSLTWSLIPSACFILGVMQATSMGGCKLEKRYSPSFRDEPQRKMSASKRKRDDILRWVSLWFYWNLISLNSFIGFVWTYICTHILFMILWILRRSPFIIKKYFQFFRYFVVVFVRE